jgi:flavin reductase (DIM6/NTAB) family NADH-FMN oxidoreductase RutF
MAATAVVSVCAEPPALLVAVNRSASIHAILSASDEFCVNLLSHRHAELVAAFSGKLKGAARFAEGDWRYTETGVPVLADALASIVCRTISRVDIGTHTLFIGEAAAIANHADIAPLAWMDGGFARCEPLGAL